MSSDESVKKVDSDGAAATREPCEHGEIAAGHLALLFHVVTDVRRDPDGDVHLTEPLGLRTPALE